MVDPCDNVCALQCLVCASVCLSMLIRYEVPNATRMFFAG